MLTLVPWLLSLSTVPLLSEELGVPLDGSATAALADALPQAGVSALAAEAAMDDDSVSDPLGGLRVTGVTMSPMRFVTTSDGRRLFEGARLPGGCTLDSISTSTLTLRRGENVFTYRLRGPQ